VARLHADSAFKTDLEAAKTEVAAARARGLKPRRDCEAEASALAQDPF
jgi:acid phosphatase (class A)